MTPEIEGADPPVLNVLDKDKFKTEAEDASASTNVKKSPRDDEEEGGRSRKTKYEL